LRFNSSDPISVVNSFSGTETHALIFAINKADNNIAKILFFIDVLLFLWYLYYTSIKKPCQHIASSVKKIYKKHGWYLQKCPFSVIMVAMKPNGGRADDLGAGKTATCGGARSA
jgi:hypothetical protein